ncbi:histidine kinase [Thioclava sp. SK-1]|uniref:DUF6446 family protein n=1 Tax=Thioclava sp. SK-1 TaxID=1889770 RepID=UPI0008271D38|nr:DUF6446 family protein [Thioclava sp. SK-1]OCX61052.1 histidine kinase [Thioclava sp. SK-1]
MNGKWVGAGIVISALVFGGVVYYTQMYGYYQPVPASADSAEIRLTSMMDGTPEVIETSNFEGIDADSSPLRFRGCFTTPLSLATATETYTVYEGATPLNGPGWFECYNAAQLGEDLQTGAAVAFLSEHQISPGVDRVVAIYPDGRAFAWHQLNDTSEK